MAILNHKVLQLDNSTLDCINTGKFDHNLQVYNPKKPNITQ